MPMNVFGSFVPEKLKEKLIAPDTSSETVIDPNVKAGGVAAVGVVVDIWPMAELIEPVEFVAIDCTLYDVDGVKFEIYVDAYNVGKGGTLLLTTGYNCTVVVGGDAVPYKAE